MSLTFNIGQDYAQEIMGCIKNIAGSVSESDIVEIILKKSALEKENKNESPTAVMTSREVADILGRPHTSVVKQISKFLCETKKDEKRSGFILKSFVCSHRNKKEYPMYEMTETACKEYRNLVKHYAMGKERVMAGIERLDQAMSERFHPSATFEFEELMREGFLLQDKPRSEYEAYCNMFNQFITGPAVEGREITELTEAYRKFYKTLNASPLEAKENNQLECALFDVAIEAEMQGFVYGVKMLDVLLNQIVLRKEPAKCENTN